MSATGSSHALTDLVEDVYLLARLDSGTTSFEIGEVDLTEVADESVEILRPVAARNRVQISLIASQRFMATASSEPVGRVFRNLIDNAIRHSPPGATVDIRLERANGHVTARVSDQGPGFDPAFRPVAFERFSRPEVSRGRATGGSGLGLAIARGLVEAMGGQIWIGDGDGGRVGFALPAAREAGDVRPAPPDPTDRRRRTSSPPRA